MRNGIRNWHNGIEPEVALLVTRHDSSAVRSGALLVLHVVEAFAVRLPNVNLDALDRLPGCVLYCADDETSLSVWIVGDGAAVWFILGFVSVERTQDCAFCTGGWFGMIDAIYQE